MNSTQNNDIFNPSTWTDQDRDLLDMAMKLTPDQLDLLLTIMDLVAGRPDLLEYAAKWEGKMKDLPEALRKIA